MASICYCEGSFPNVIVEKYCIMSNIWCAICESSQDNRRFCLKTIINNIVNGFIVDCCNDCITSINLSMSEIPVCIDFNNVKEEYNNAKTEYDFEHTMQSWHMSKIGASADYNNKLSWFFYQ